LDNSVPLLAGERRGDQDADDVALAVEDDMGFPGRGVNGVTRRRILYLLPVPIRVLHVLFQEFRVVGVSEEWVIEGLD
jgi:hypothetical protein